MGSAKHSRMSENTETAILAGGCFWPAQQLLRERDGVISTRVGYTGGENVNPTAFDHPGHAEAVAVIFDPERTSYRDILEFFFQIHRADLDAAVVGSDYRSEIFYTTEEQRRVAEDTLRRRRRLGDLARQSRDEDQPGRALLGGRARGPGLSQALPRRQESVQSLARPIGRDGEAVGDLRFSLALELQFHTGSDWFRKAVGNALGEHHLATGSLGL